MTRVCRYDTSRLAKFARNGAGAVRVPATTSRTGIQLYPGAGPGGRTLREYRPPEEVFAADSLASFAGVPVTLGHPPEGVTPANMRAVTVGHVSDLPPETRVKLDADPNEWVKAQLIIGDGELLDAIESSDKAPEISCGYSCELDMTPGVAPNGEHYDCVQRKIVLNHVAVLLGDSKARAGADARLRLDNQEPMKKIVIDGVELDYGSDAHLNAVQSKADAVVKSEKDRADRAEGALAAANARADKAEAELTPAKVDSRVEARLSLLKAASEFLKAGYETSGKSDSEIRKDALVASGADVAGKSDSFLEGSFAELTRKDKPAQFHNPGTKPAPRADAAGATTNLDNDENFSAHLAKLASGGESK